VGLLSVLTALPVNAKETATLVLSNDVARINLSGQQGRGTPSGQIATLVLSSGERPSGDLVELDARGYTLRVNGQDRIFSANTVAAIEYVAPRLPAAVQSRVDAGESLIVMRTGQVIPGRLVDIGGNQPKRLTLDTPSGQRVFLSNTVAQIYLFPFNIGAQPSANLEEADHNPSWAERYMSWTEAGFTSLDHNRDRRITSNEWHYARETFLRADRNRDGALDRTEFLGADMDDDRGDQFDDLDVNRNGRIERTEWHASNAAFVWLDQDGDGLISRSEMTGDELATSPKDQFASLDSDGNGTIARDEWHWSLGSFNQWGI
jgi:Ca2+-binding EF-hand superfamily protein